MLRPATLATALLAMILSAATLADEPRAGRVALVIGNGAYPGAPLPNALNDAADMAAALKESGFTVVRRDNASLKDMHSGLREFGDKLGRGSVGLFFFAGHGVQVRGRNYLVPVDADIAREDEVSYSALDLAAVLEKMDTARNPVNLVILDACRNNPFATKFQLSAPGLAQIDAPAGTLIAFSTAPGSVAADGTGRNGLYTHNLLREMARPGLAIEEVFKAVRASVRKSSAGKQIPWESTSLETAFAFRDAPRPVPVAVAAKGPAQAQSVPRALPASIGAPPSFAKGDRWTFRLKDQVTGTERSFTFRVKDIKGDEVHYDNGNVSDVVGNSIKGRSRGRATTYAPLSLFFAFPLKTGASYPFQFLQDSEGRLYDVEGSIKVVAEEEIEVPAGRMKALRIEREARWRERGKDNKGTNRTTYWYNSGVKRAIRMDSHNSASTGKVYVNERIDLERYEVR